MAIDPVTGVRLSVGRNGVAIVQCDSYGCLNGISTGSTRRDVTREQAAEQGWVFEQGHDFCPLHVDIHPVLWAPGQARDLPTSGPVGEVDGGSTD